MAQCEVQRCPLFGRYQGKSGRHGHRVFVDAEVIRGGPLLEVAGHGREAWRAAPGSARLLRAALRPRTQSAGGVTASEIYMRQSEPPCSRKSAVPALHSLV